MSRARQLIEGNGPDDINPKSELLRLPEARIVKMEVMLRFQEPFDEMDMRILLDDVANALQRQVHEAGLSLEDNLVVECTVTPIQPARGIPTGWDIESVGF